MPRFDPQPRTLAARRGVALASGARVARGEPPKYRLSAAT
jgi:hypothetical protein